MRLQEPVGLSPARFFVEDAKDIEVVALSAKLGSASLRPRRVTVRVGHLAPELGAEVEPGRV